VCGRLDLSKRRTTYPDGAIAGELSDVLVTSLYLLLVERPHSAAAQSPPHGSITNNANHAPASVSLAGLSGSLFSLLFHFFLAVAVWQHNGRYVKIFSNRFTINFLQNQRILKIG